MNRDATEPASGTIDELRIGASWATSTPPGGHAPPVLTLPISGPNVPCFLADKFDWLQSA